MKPYGKYNKPGSSLKQQIAYAEGKLDVMQMLLRGYDKERSALHASIRELNDHLFKIEQRQKVFMKRKKAAAKRKKSNPHPINVARAMKYTLDAKKK